MPSTSEHALLLALVEALTKQTEALNRQATSMNRQARAIDRLAASNEQIVDLLQMEQVEVAEGVEAQPTTYLNGQPIQQ